MHQVVKCLLLAVCLFLYETNCAEEAKKPAKQQPRKEIVLEGVNFAVFDRDLNQPAEADLKSLAPGQKLPSKYSLDAQRKLRLSFSVKDKHANAATTVHQAFVVLVHGESKREIIFIAEPDKTTMTYSFDMDVKTNGKDFAGVGGLYSTRLVLGDFSVSNPMDWHFVDLDLTVPAHSPPQLPKSSRVNYELLPEIRHAFREQEPRPPAILSDSFAVICAAPLLLMLILWLRIGLNFGNIKFSIWALGFHVGLCAIFGLYSCYWLQLNMFETLKYLAIVGVPTLFCGNRLLHSFSTAKKQKPE